MLRSHPHHANNGQHHKNDAAAAVDNNTSSRNCLNSASPLLKGFGFGNHNRTTMKKAKKKMVNIFFILGLLTQLMIFYRYVVFLIYGRPPHLTNSMASHASLMHRKAMELIQQGGSISSSTPLLNNNKYGLLLVVPGIGDAERIPMLKKSVQTIASTLIESPNTMNHRFECIVYVWNTLLLQEVSEALTECKVEYSKGKWTHHMLKVPSLVESTPENSWITHVAVLIDDIDVSKVNALSFLDVMTQAGYGVGSAAFPQWHYDALHSRLGDGCLSHRTDFADVLFTVFKKENWIKWQNRISIEINEYGWGYDVTLADTCNVTVGIIDSAVAEHSGKCENGGDCTRSYSEDYALKQMWDWIQHAAPLREKNEQSAQDYWRYVTVYRPQHFPKCDLLTT